MKSSLLFNRNEEINQFNLETSGMKQLILFMMKVLDLMVGMLGHLIPPDRKTVVFADAWMPYLDSNAHVLYNYLELHRKDLKLHIFTRKNPWGVWRLPRAKYIIITHGPYDLVSRSLARQGKRTIINLMHSVQLKNKGLLELCRQQPLESREYKKKSEQMIRDAQVYSRMTVSSERERGVMWTQYRVPPDRIVITGLARNDFFRNSNLIDSCWTEKMEKLIDGNDKDDGGGDGDKQHHRYVILYTPTWRDDGNLRGQLHALTDFSAQKLENFLQEHDAVLIYRNHHYDLQHTNTLQDIYSQCRRIRFAPPNIYPYVQPFLKAADLLITDFSSIYYDFLLTGKPMISISHDLHNYLQTKGFLFDYPRAFPGPKVFTFTELLEEIESALQNPEKYASMRDEQRERFHMYQDGRACERIATLFGR